MKLKLKRWKDCNGYAVADDLHVKMCLDIVLVQDGLALYLDNQIKVGYIGEWDDLQHSLSTQIELSDYTYVAEIIKINKDQESIPEIELDVRRVK